jgi:hypothetical protein
MGAGSYHKYLAKITLLFLITLIHICYFGTKKIMSIFTEHSLSDKTHCTSREWAQVWVSGSALCIEIDRISIDW